VKAHSQQQFQAATEPAVRELAKGTPNAAIVDILNGQEMNTPTGR
jgi:hypothetical protein